MLVNVTQIKVFNESNSGSCDLLYLQVKESHALIIHLRGSEDAYFGTSDKCLYLLSVSVAFWFQFCQFEDMRLSFN